MEKLEKFGRQTPLQRPGQPAELVSAKKGHAAADTWKESEMAETRLFDLSIEKILEAWDTCHAVRELIANTLDGAFAPAMAWLVSGEDRNGMIRGCA